MSTYNKGSIPAPSFLNTRTNPDTAVSNGWDNKGMNDIVNQIKVNQPAATVLQLQWSQASQARRGKFGDPTTVKQAARWIVPVAKVYAKKLEEWGLTDSTKLNCIGHSLGAYLCEEIARQMDGGNRLIALDVAREGYIINVYDIDGNTYGEQRPDYNDYLRKNYKFSRAFVGSGSISGNQTLSQTASESYLIEYGANFSEDAFAGGNEHGWVVKTIANMMNNRYIMKPDAAQSDPKDPLKGILLNLFSDTVVFQYYLKQNAIDYSGQYYLEGSKHEGIILLSNLSESKIGNEINQQFNPLPASLKAVSENSKNFCSSTGFVRYGLAQADVFKQLGECESIYSSAGDDNIIGNAKTSLYVDAGEGADVINWDPDMPLYIAERANIKKHVKGGGGSDTFRVGNVPVKPPIPNPTPDQGVTPVPNQPIIPLDWVIEDFANDKIELSGTPSEYKIEPSAGNSVIISYQNRFALKVQGSGVTLDKFDRDLKNLIKEDPTTIFFKDTQL